MIEQAVSVKDNYRITWLIRGVFRGMARVAGEALEPLGISAADRAVMEFLFPDEALSVPEIAARYDVSRQHVQVTVNSLLDKQLAERLPNPRHKRSDLIHLTPSGKKVFEQVFSREVELTETLFADLPGKQLATTLKVLTRLNHRLEEGDQ
jgi:DNA-binding MarR family transcriptional regulator